MGLIYLLVACAVCDGKKHGEDLAAFVRQYKAGSAAAGAAAKRPLDADALVAAAEAHRARIRAHYGLGDGEAEMLDSTIFGVGDGGVDGLRRALLRGVARGEVRIAQMGISITAGHDIFHNESFSHVFGRHFGAVLATAGIGTRLRNHAVGGFGTMPSHVCGPAMVGADNDVVAWDFMMMADRGSCAVEHLQRALALAAPSVVEAPALLWWQGGVWLPTEKPENYKDPKRPGSNQKQTCNGAWVAKHYAPIGAHVGDFGATLQRLREKGLPLLQEGTDPLYMDPRKGADPAPGMDEPDLPMRRRLARHHPGAPLHRLWGLVWAHAYLGQLISALKPAPPGVVPPARSGLPKRAGCEADLCEDVAPTCLTSMLPRAAGSELELKISLKGSKTWVLRDDAKRRSTNERYGYLDDKVLLSGTKADGELLLTIDVATAGRPIVACEAPCPWGKCPAGRLPLRANSAWTLDGAKLDVTAEAPKSLKIFDVKNTCFVVAPALDTAGTHTLGITITAPGGYAGLTHLLFY